MLTTAESSCKRYAKVPRFRRHDYPFRLPGSPAVPSPETLDSFSASYSSEDDLSYHYLVVWAWLN